jgi:GrpB protein
LSPFGKKGAVYERARAVKLKILMSADTEWFGEPKCDLVVISDPDPRWPALSEEFRSSLSDALGETALRIDHVGSTAVPGLPAKPVIDIQVSVRDVKDEPSYGKAIESVGWPLRASDEVVFRGRVLPSSSAAPGSEMACWPSMLGSRAISAVPMTDEYFRGNAAAIPESRVDRHVRV